MEKKPYEAPKVYELGTVQQLTHATGEADKCSGSDDQFLPQQLSPVFSKDCP